MSSSFPLIGKEEIQSSSWALTYLPLILLFHLQRFLVDNGDNKSLNQREGAKKRTPTESAGREETVP